jgi:hypothetical protein
MTPSARNGNSRKATALPTIALAYDTKSLLPGIAGCNTNCIIMLMTIDSQNIIQSVFLLEVNILIYQMQLN